MRYLDESDNFIRGTYRSENVYDVAEEDPQYLNWLLNEITLEASERELINVALGNETEDIL